MSAKLYLHITYPIANPDAFQIKSDIKPEALTEIIMTFLRGQMGKGADASFAIERDVYHIRMEVDLESDTFAVRHDTGNLGLRDGILLDVARRLKM
jgi:hypothetical protein